jgi:hypothetical protein
VTDEEAREAALGLVDALERRDRRDPHRHIQRCRYRPASARVGKAGISSPVPTLRSTAPRSGRLGSSNLGRAGVPGCPCPGAVPSGSFFFPNERHPIMTALVFPPPGRPGRGHPDGDLVEIHVDVTRARPGATLTLRLHNGADPVGLRAGKAARTPSAMLSASPSARTSA